MGWRSPVKGVRMEKIRVLLADDYIPYRWSVLAGLSNDASIEVIEEASDGEEAVRKALEYMPDVILLDLHMPICDGHEATRRILAENPHIKIIINTISESESDLETALKNGARGYLIKEGDPEQIAEAVRYVHQGGILISPSMAGKIADEFIPGGVSGQPEEPVDNEELIWDALTDEDLDSGTLTAEIAISPPVEPAEMLKLFSWLGGDLEATVEKVVPSLVKDTVLTVIFSRAHLSLSPNGGVGHRTQCCDRPNLRQKSCGAIWPFCAFAINSTFTACVIRKGGCKGIDTERLQWKRGGRSGRCATGHPEGVGTP